MGARLSWTQWVGVNDKVVGKALPPNARQPRTSTAGRALRCGSLAACVAQGASGMVLVNLKVSKLYNKSTQSSVSRCYLYIPR